MKLPSFCGDSYVSQSPLASVARTVNFIPERIEVDGAKVKVALYPIPGLAPFAAAIESPGRGLFEHKGRLFTGIGNVIYEVGSGGVLGKRGTVVLDGNPVFFDTNGDLGGQLGLASGGSVYMLDLNTNAFSNPTNNVNMLVCVDGRFIGLDSSTSTLRLSNSGNGLVWNILQTTQRATGTDPWKAIAVSSSKELYVLGDKTGDVYYNSGASPFPFVPRQGILLKPGIIAPASLKELNGAMIWLSNSEGGSGHVVRAAGYNPQPISNAAVENAIGRYKRTSRIDDAIAFTYEEDNHYFYELNFPTADATWVWDETTNWWHERGKWDKKSGTYLAWGPQHHASAFGHHIVTDHRSGTLYRMASDAYLDADGLPLRRLRIAGGPFEERKTIYLDHFQVYLEPGQGANVGQGADPQIFLSTSRNGGKTYGSERWRSAGRIGHLDATIDWFQLGSAVDWALSVVMSDPVPWRILDAFFSAHVGNR